MISFYNVCAAIVALCFVGIAYCLGVMRGIRLGRTNGVTLSDFHRMTQGR